MAVCPTHGCLNDVMKRFEICGQRDIDLSPYFRFQAVEFDANRGDLLCHGVPVPMGLRFDPDFHAGMVTRCHDVPSSIKANADMRQVAVKHLAAA